MPSRAKTKVTTVAGGIFYLTEDYKTVHRWIVAAAQDGAGQGFIEGHEDEHGYAVLLAAKDISSVEELA